MQALGETPSPPATVPGSRALQQRSPAVSAGTARTHPPGWGSGVLASVSLWPQQRGARGVLPGLCQSRMSSLITALVEMVEKGVPGSSASPSVGSSAQILSRSCCRHLWFCHCFSGTCAMICLSLATERLNSCSQLRHWGAETTEMPGTCSTGPPAPRASSDMGFGLSPASPPLQPCCRGCSVPGGHHRCLHACISSSSCSWH